MSDIRINIVGNFVRKGFNDADRATKSLGRSFDKLGFKVGAALSTAAILKFSKESIKAFAEDDKAIKRLITTYNNLGMAFEATLVNDYVDRLQRATGVADSELRPALETLTRATLDYTKAQQLLGVAMDVSAGTGLDLNTVTKALAKAQLGQMTTLARLNIGIGQAEAKTISFDEALTRLNSRFKGQAAIAADTYAGRMARLKIAADEAKESLGKDLVFALGKLSNDMSLTTFGDQIQRVADNVGNIAIGFSSIIGELNKTPQAAQKGGWWDKFDSFMAKWNVFVKLRSKGEFEQTMASAAPSRGGAPGAQRLALENKKIMQQQLAAQAKLVAAQNKAAKDAAARDRQAKQLKAASAMFDLQNIQIEAALKGKISDNERTRLLLMKAIQEENGKAAEDLTQKLIDSQKRLDDVTKSLLGLKSIDPFKDWQTNATLLNTALASLKAADPFKDWKGYFQYASSLVTALQSQLSNVASQLQGLLNSAKAGSVSAATAAAAQAASGAQDKATGSAAAAAGTDAAITAAEELAKAAAAAAAAAKAAAEEAAKKQAADAKALQDAADNTAKAAAAAADAAKTIVEADAAAQMVYALDESKVADLMAQEAAKILADLGLIDYGALAKSSMTTAGGTAYTGGYQSSSFYAGAAATGTTIIVNVAGSVTTQSDLVEAITDQLYTYQKTGKGLILSSVGV